MQAQYYSNQFPVVPRTLDGTRVFKYHKSYPRNLPRTLGELSFIGQHFKDLARGKAYMMSDSSLMKVEYAQLHNGKFLNKFVGIDILLESNANNVDDFEMRPCRLCPNTFYHEKDSLDYCCHHRYGINDLNMFVELASAAVENSKALISSLCDIHIPDEKENVMAKVDEIIEQSQKLQFLVNFLGDDGEEVICRHPITGQIDEDSKATVNMFALYCLDRNGQIVLPPEAKSIVETAMILDYPAVEDPKDRYVTVVDFAPLPDFNDQVDYTFF